MCSDADREAHEVGRDAARALVLLAELRVGGGGRMDGQALGVADVGEVREELQAVDELLPAVPAALDAEDDHARRTPRSRTLLAIGWAGSSSRPG